MMEIIQEELTSIFAEQNVTFRRAKHHGGTVTPYNAHNWVRNNNVANAKRGLNIFIHDDLSLAMDPKFEGFEI